MKMKASAVRLVFAVVMASPLSFVPGFAEKGNCLFPALAAMALPALFDDRVTQGQIGGPAVG